MLPNEETNEWLTSIGPVSIDVLSWCIHHGIVDHGRLEIVHGEEGVSTTGVALVVSFDQVLPDNNVHRQDDDHYEGKIQIVSIKWWTRKWNDNNRGSPRELLEAFHKFRKALLAFLTKLLWIMLINFTLFVLFWLVIMTNCSKTVKERLQNKWYESRSLSSLFYHRTGIPVLTCFKWRTYHAYDFRVGRKAV